MSKIGWIVGGLLVLAGGSALAAGKKRREQDASARAARAINEMSARAADRAEFGPLPKQSLVDREVWIEDKGEQVTLHVTAEDANELRGFVISEDGEQHQRGEQMRVPRSALRGVVK